MTSKLQGELRVPGDKSISHRALIFSALARGECTIRGLSPAEDCRSTRSCLARIGMDSTDSPDGAVKILSPGLTQLNAPETVLDAGNSGTTMRLISGLLAGQAFASVLDGDESLRRRPMSRIAEPLSHMGATIEYKQQPGCAPFSVTGGRLSGITIDAPLASAQVQTCVLLAGLQAEGETSVAMLPSVRDHTGRLFSHIGVPFSQPQDGTITVSRLPEPLKPFNIVVPADISSAAFFMVGAACLPNSEITLLEVGINPGRRLIIDALNDMGAAIELLNQRELCGEPVADIRIRYNGRLNALTIGGGAIASGIDEIPILALAGSLCNGRLIVRGAEELRHKESDRLAAIVNNLKAIGAEIEETEDGFIIDGKESLPGGADWKTHGDHRLAMTGLVANLICDQPNKIDDVDCARISYPEFTQHLGRLQS